MILSKEFYDQCCPTYQKLIDKLEEKIAKLGAKNDEVLDDEKMYYQIETAILKFAENYLTPREYWDYCIIQMLNLENADYEINAIGYHHFYFDHELNFLCSPGEDTELYHKLMDYIPQDDFNHRFYNPDESDINYPHNYLTRCFRYFENHALRLPSIQVIKRYEEMKLLYPKIKAAENDVERWFKLLLEAEDDTFVEDNVEYRLGKNLHDVNLWMLYIEYLEQKGHINELLKVYSNYCRFFLEDFDMLEKYKSKMMKYGPVKNLHWHNLFDFELDKNNEHFEMQNDENVKNEEVDYMDNECEMKSVKEESLDVDDENIHSDEDDDIQNSDIFTLEKQLFKSFFDTYQFQKFPFKEPMMNYILKNANHRLLRRLLQSCKYFFYKQPTPICYRLDDRGSPKFDSECLTLSHMCNTNLYVKNTFITGSIDLKYSPNNDKTYMSKLIPRLSRCEAKYINLISQNLTFKEFKFLVSHGQVVKYAMLCGHIEDENNEYVDLEKITAYLPNIEKLCLRKVKCNANTAHALSNQCFNGKIYDFLIAIIYGEPFDPNEFLKFCVKIRDETIKCRMIFDKNFDATFVTQFNEIMTDYKESCPFTVIDVRLIN